MPYLCPFAHFQKGTNRVEGTCAADVQMGLVVGLEHSDEVITLPLKEKWDKVHQKPNRCLQLAKGFKFSRKYAISASVYVVMLPAEYTISPRKAHETFGIFVKASVSINLPPYRKV